MFAFLSKLYMKLGISELPVLMRSLCISSHEMTSIFHYSRAHVRKDYINCLCNIEKRIAPHVFWGRPHVLRQSDRQTFQFLAPDHADTDINRLARRTWRATTICHKNHNAIAMCAHE